MWQRLCIIKRSAFRDTHIFLNEFRYLERRIRTTTDITDKVIALFLLNAVRESYPNIYAKYSIREKELTYKALLKDINTLQAIEKSHISSGFAAFDQQPPQ
ncbi:hypothetical protein IMZ48_36245 [Candidatus Bathyarchaeota archaeon]|nr:hypothetical protein [Candidatus Bathyarchaeota archaeon]